MSHAPEREEAIEILARLGFRGADVYLAELIIAVEMAWADGQIQEEERATLEAYCEELVLTLNREAGGAFFSLRRAFELLDAACERRLSPADRVLALSALKRFGAASSKAAEDRAMRWASKVAASAGWPRWDTRELFWLQTIRRAFDAHRLHAERPR